MHDFDSRKPSASTRTAHVTLAAAETSSPPACLVATKNGVELNLARIAELLRHVRQQSATFFSTTVERVGDTFAFFGNTGAGKTTAIHWLLQTGLKIVTLEDTFMFGDTQEHSTRQVFEACSPLPGSSIGHDNKSCTVGAHLHCGPTFAALDLAGLNDTTGAEQDIANALVLGHALERCHNVIYVVLVNASDLTADRGSPTINLLEKLMTFLQPTEHAAALTDALESVIFLFSHVAARRTSELKRDVGSLLSHTKVVGSEQLKAAVGRMYACLTKHQDVVLLSRSAMFDEKGTSRDSTKMLHAIESCKRADGRRRQGCPLSGATVAQLRETCRKALTCLRDALAHQGNETQLMVHLRSLLGVVGEANLDELNRMGDEAVDLVRKTIERYGQRVEYHCHAFTRMADLDVNLSLVDYEETSRDTSSVGIPNGTTVSVSTSPSDSFDHEASMSSMSLGSSGEVADSSSDILSSLEDFQRSSRVNFARTNANSLARSLDSLRRLAALDTVAWHERANVAAGYGERAWQRAQQATIATLRDIFFLIQSPVVPSMGCVLDTLCGAVQSTEAQQFLPQPVQDSYVEACRQIATRCAELAKLAISVLEVLCDQVAGVPCVSPAQPEWLSLASWMDELSVIDALSSHVDSTEPAPVATYSKLKDDAARLLMSAEKQVHDVLHALSNPDEVTQSKVAPLRAGLTVALALMARDATGPRGVDFHAAASSLPESCELEGLGGRLLDQARKALVALLDRGLRLLMENNLCSATTFLRAACFAIRKQDSELASDTAINEAVTRARSTLHSMVAACLKKGCKAQESLASATSPATFSGARASAELLVECIAQLKVLTEVDGLAVAQVQESADDQHAPHQASASAAALALEKLLRSAQAEWSRSYETAAASVTVPLNYADLKTHLCLLDVREPLAAVVKDAVNETMQLLQRLASILRESPDIQVGSDASASCLVTASMATKDSIRLLLQLESSALTKLSGTAGRDHLEKAMATLRHASALACKRATERLEMLSTAISGNIDLREWKAVHSALSEIRWLRGFDSELNNTPLASQETASKVLATALRSHYQKACEALREGRLDDLGENRQALTRAREANLAEHLDSSFDLDGLLAEINDGRNTELAQQKQIIQDQIDVRNFQQAAKALNRLRLSAEEGDTGAEQLLRSLDHRIGHALIEIRNELDDLFGMQSNLKMDSAQLAQLSKLLRASSEAAALANFSTSFAVSELSGAAMEHWEDARQKLQRHLTNHSLLQADTVFQTLQIMSRRMPETEEPSELDLLDQYSSIYLPSALHDALNATYDDSESGDDSSGGSDTECPRIITVEVAKIICAFDDLQKRDANFNNQLNVLTTRMQVETTIRDRVRKIMKQMRKFVNEDQEEKALIIIENLEELGNTCPSLRESVTELQTASVEKERVAIENGRFDMRSLEDKLLREPMEFAKQVQAASLVTTGADREQVENAVRGCTRRCSDALTRLSAVLLAGAVRVGGTTDSTADDAAGAYTNAATLAQSFTTAAEQAKVIRHHLPEDLQRLAQQLREGLLDMMKRVLDHVGRVPIESGVNFLTKLVHAMEATPVDSLAEISSRLATSLQERTTVRDKRDAAVAILQANSLLQVSAAVQTQEALQELVYVAMDEGSRSPSATELKGCAARLTRDATAMRVPEAPEEVAAHEVMACAILNLRTLKNWLADVPGVCDVGHPAHCLDVAIVGAENRLLELRSSHAVTLQRNLGSYYAQRDTAAFNALMTKTRACAAMQPGCEGEQFTRGVVAFLAQEAEKADPDFLVPTGDASVLAERIIAQCTQLRQINDAGVQEIIQGRVSRMMEQLVFPDQGTTVAVGRLLIKAGNVGVDVVERYPAFSKARVIHFNSRLSTMGATNAIDELRKQNPDISDQQADILLQGLEKYGREFEAQIRAYLEPLREPSLLPLITRVKADCADVKTGREPPRSRLSRALAGIFAVWTVTKARSAGVEPQEIKHGAQDVLMRPHMAQVLAILRLLALDKEGGWVEKLSKAVKKRVRHVFGAARGLHFKPSGLSETKTGEGKSVLLGVLATLMALLGFDVDATCYSHYLSERDGNAFSSLFEMFGVEDHITYSTLPEAVNNLLNQEGDVRDLSRLLITKGARAVQRKMQSRTAARASSRPKVILIDEVDTFLSPSFLGSTYNAVSIFYTAATDGLLRHIYAIREKKPRKADVLAHHYCVQLLGELVPEAQRLLENEVDAMCRDVQTYGSTAYIVHERQIGYSSHDGVATNHRIGYRTAFHFLDAEEQNKTLDGDQAQRHLGLSLACGNFAFGLMAEQFHGCLAVTGTYQCQTAAAKELLSSKLGLRYATLMPSIYGVSRRDFRPNMAGHVVLASDCDAQHQAICTYIEEARDQQRPLLLVFADMAAKQTFKDSTYGRRALQEVSQEERNATQDLDETTLNKDHVISRAMDPGTVTMTVAVLGRGLDYRCEEESVDRAGGVIVLQTFFSLSKSEEIQIAGRTARQGRKGEYRLLVERDALMRDLEMTADEVDAADAGHLYEALDKRRVELADSKLQATMKGCERSQARHNKSLQYVQALCSPGSDTKTLVDLLCDLQ